MAKGIIPLSDTKLRNAKPREKEYNLSDGQGLQCRIKPSGLKVWLYNYKRPSDGKRTNLSVGRYPATSIALARKKRSEFDTLLANGIDPAEALKGPTKQSPTLFTVATRWHEIKRHEVTADYATDIWRSLEMHVFHRLGELAIDEVTPQGVIATLSPLAEKGSLESVKRVCQRLNEIMVFAVNTGLVSYNPIAGVRHAFKSPKTKNMATIRPDELGQFMKDVMNANMRRVTKLLISWQLHTMCRPSEASGAKWSEIDWDKQLWIIPAERMKKGLEHCVPLTPQTMDILKELQKLNDGSEFLFPADRKRGEPTNPQTANMAIKRMGYGGKLVAHGLRALASTTLNEHGFHPDVIEAALAHVDKNTVRRAYNRAKYLERRHEMMLWWNKYIENETRK